jgi:hypothetical protein
MELFCVSIYCIEWFSIDQNNEKSHKCCYGLADIALFMLNFTSYYIQFKKTVNLMLFDTADGAAGTETKKRDLRGKELKRDQKVPVVFFPYLASSILRVTLSLIMLRV